MIKEALDNMWQCGSFGDDILNDAKVEFCAFWHEYAPNLCQWIMDNALEFDDYEECCALFASEMDRANKLFNNEKHKKEILAAGVAYSRQNY